jgi:phosphoglycolate phosphatase-like HAD superfamily hydrolase
MKIKVRAIGFDWDGTIVDSMRVKAESFAESIIKSYPPLKTKRKEIEGIYFETRGTLRIDQLAFIQKKYHLEKMNVKKTKKWSHLFTSMYLKKKMPLFRNALVTLKELKKRGYKLFLSSSVPHNDLIKTLKLYQLENLFEYTLGTKENGKFKKGLPHLKYISSKLNIPMSKIAFVGDAKYDILLAKKAKTFSIGIIDPRNLNSSKEIKQAKPKIIIENFLELLKYFK